MRNVKEYLKYRKDHCECCGFYPDHPRQLEVHHVDCNHENNHLDNLETLCCNCHKLWHLNPDKLKPKTEFMEMIRKTLILYRSLRARNKSFCPEI